MESPRERANEKKNNNRQLCQKDQQTNRETHARHSLVQEISDKKC
jgi:hypothetical protein